MTASTGSFANCSRAKVRMFTMPVWPQPVRTTSPSGVLRTSLSQVWVGGQSNGMQVIPTKVEPKAASNAAAERHSVSAKAR